MFSEWHFTLYPHLCKYGQRCIYRLTYIYEQFLTISILFNFVLIFNLDILKWNTVLYKLCSIWSHMMFQHVSFLFISSFILIFFNLIKIIYKKKQKPFVKIFYLCFLVVLCWICLIPLSLPRGGKYFSIFIFNLSLSEWGLQAWNLILSFYNQKCPQIPGRRYMISTDLITFTGASRNQFCCYSGKSVMFKLIMAIWQAT